MGELELKPAPFYKRPIVWGWLGTGFVVVIGYAAAISKACAPSAVGLADCPTKWAYLATASPNELGDTLAGFAGALAFIWIIVTVAMQSLELAAQREELRLTRRESKRMADALTEQLTVLQLQAKVFEDETKQRLESRAAAEVQQRLERISQLLTDEANSEFFSRRSQERHSQFVIPASKIHIFEAFSEGTIDDHIREQRVAPTAYLKKVETLQEKGQLERADFDKSIVSSVLQETHAIIDMMSRLGSDQKLRIRNCGILELTTTLTELQESDFWDNSK